MVRIHPDKLPPFNNDVPPRWRPFMRADFVWLRCVEPCSRHRHEAEAFAQRHRGPEGMFPGTFVPFIPTQTVAVELIEVVGSLGTSTH